MENIFETIAIKAAGLTAEHPMAAALSGREDIMGLTQKTHDAALTPKAPGGLSHAVRAALACRIARLNDEKVLAEHFHSMIGSGDDTIADPAHDGRGDVKLNALIRHTDLVAARPKDATPDDIEALKSAGVPDDDIVRLSELIAFISYQIRLVAGLRLMAEVA